MIVDINPNIFVIPNVFGLGEIAIRWYALAYVLGFIIGLLYVRKRFREKDFRAAVKLPIDFEWDVAFWAALGVIIGGRLGFVLFYMPGYFLTDPLKILSIRDGGMSFHGGMILSLVAVWLYVRYKGLNMNKIADVAIPIVPIGLFLGRIGNFINGELYGRPTELPWGMIFQRYGGNIKRHPSQLYEALFEGIFLFFILFFIDKMKRKNKKLQDGIVLWSFVLFYGIFRFFLEFTREPDNYFQNAGFFFGSLTMGQLLSIPMVILSIIMIYWVQKGIIEKKQQLYFEKHKEDFKKREEKMREYEGKQKLLAEQKKKEQLKKLVAQNKLNKKKKY